MASSGRDTTAAADPAIAIRDLSISYGAFRALNRVNADIAPRTVTALIGPSGCGKTTLLRSLNRINESVPGVRSEGAIRILGEDIFAAEVSLAVLRRRVAMVFQRPNPLPMSVYDNVAFGLRVHKARHALHRSVLDEAVENALRRVDLFDSVRDRLRCSAMALTLEEQQKLCIARVLPAAPSVLLMDEPCSALDMRGTARIEELMRELSQTHTVVVVTHSMAQARRVSDSSMFMLLGELIEHGPTADLLGAPRDPRTAAYVSGRYG